MSDHETSSSALPQRLHPGRGRGRARGTNKGRQVDEAARTEVRAVLGERPRRRDLLIEHLHLLRDTFGGLRMRHLAALAEHMGLAMAEVYETASFYAHFDLLDDDAPDLPEITIRICDSLSCEMAGSAELMEGLLDMLDGRARIVRAPCMGRCDSAPAAEVGHRHIGHATTETVSALLASGETEAIVPTGISFEDYRAGGGYGLLEAYRSGARAYDDLAAEVSAADLRGMGGAGFPAARRER